MDEKVHIFLFGGFRLQVGDRPLPLFRSHAARSLFAFLVTHGDRRHTRSYLAGLFWPETPESQGRQRLSQCLYEINRVLRDLETRTPFLDPGRDTVGLHPDAPIWLDTAVFQQRVAQAEAAPEQALPWLEEAVALYQGDFLAGYYDEWLLAERERLRGRYLWALETLVAQQKSRGDYDTALRHASRLLRHDPLREPTYREIMRLCVLLNRPHVALRHYEQCKEHLEAELGVAPMAETTALAREIRRWMEAAQDQAGPGAITGEQRPAPSLRLVGRRREREMLIRATEETLRGRGTVILLEGEPGVGKSRLLQQLAEDASWRGLRVLQGEAQEEHQLRPYHALREAVSGDLSPLRAQQLSRLVDDVSLGAAARVLPALNAGLPALPAAPPLKAEEEERRLQEALVALLLGMAQLAPTVLIVDDIHWADQSTLALVARLTPRLKASQLSLVVAFRSGQGRERDAVWDTLRRLDLLEHSQRLSLRRLDAADTAELARQALGQRRLPPELRERLQQQTGGNPLFLLELVRVLDEAGLLVPGSDVGENEAALSRSSRLDEVIVARLDRLSFVPRRLLERVSVLGDSFDVPLLEAMAAEATPDSLFGPLETLVGRGFLLEETASYRFCHDVVRRVTYDHLDPERKRQLHRRPGRALEATRPGQIEEIARHYTLGEQWQKAVHYHLQAGDAAVELSAYATAADHYAAILSLLDQGHVKKIRPEEEGRFHLLAKQADVAQVLGRTKEVAAALQKMGSAADDSQREAEVEYRRARFHSWQGRYEAATAAARRAVRLAQEAGAMIIQIDALTQKGWVLVRQGHTEAAVSPLEEAARLAMDKGDTRREAEARHTLAVAYSYGDYARARHVPSG